jgi:hypothetical protein
VGAQVFRAVDQWQGCATIAQGDEIRDATIQLSVIAYLEIGDDGCEVDTGERVWNAHVQGAGLAFHGDVTVTLEGGEPMPARVAYGDALLGQGVPSHAGATTP